MLHAQQIVHNLEPFLSLREVDSGDIHHTLELCRRVVAQEGENGNECGRGNVQRQFVLEHRELLDKLGQALHKVRAIVVQRLCRLRMLCESRVGRRGLGEGRS